MEQVTLHFEWGIYRPDQREYRNQSIELHPSWGSTQLIAVDVPLNHNLIANSEQIIQQKLAGDLLDIPVLTITGLKYVIDQFDAVFLPTLATKPDEVEEDWEADLGGSEEKKSEPATDNEDWETDLDAGNKPDEVAWDEDTEEWK